MQLLPAVGQELPRRPALVVSDSGGPRLLGDALGIGTVATIETGGWLRTALLPGPEDFIAVRMVLQATPGIQLRVVDPIPRKAPGTGGSHRRRAACLEESACSPYTSQTW
jgi:hypothetical protein